MSDEKYIKIDEVAANLDISSKTVRKWIGQGLPAYKPGKCYFFYWSKVCEWVETHKGNKNG